MKFFTNLINAVAGRACKPLGDVIVYSFVII
jgi:hypothetical protein